MPGNITHTTPPGKPFHGATLLDQLRADCIKAGVAGREEAEAECSRLEERLRVKQDRLAVLENHQHDPDAAKRVIADILRENQADAARRTHELVWSRIGDDNAAPEPQATKPQRRAPASIPTDPDALLTAAQAAAKLNVTIEQVMAHVEDGSLRYVNISRGSKRPRYRFTQSDLNEFIAARTQEHSPCPSSPQRNRRASTGTTSNSKVIGFTARRAALRAAKPKNTKR